MKLVAVTSEVNTKVGGGVMSLPEVYHVSMGYLDGRAKTREYVATDYNGERRTIVYAVDRADAEYLAQQKTGVDMYAEPNW